MARIVQWNIQFLLLTIDEWQKIQRRDSQCWLNQYNKSLRHINWFCSRMVFTCDCSVRTKGTHALIAQYGLWYNGARSKTENKLNRYRVPWNDDEEAHNIEYIHSCKLLISTTPSKWQLSEKLYFCNVKTKLENLLWLNFMTKTLPYFLLKIYL